MYSDPDTRVTIPEDSVNVTYRRGKNLKELISPSLFPQPLVATKLQSMVSKCGKKCDICDNFLVCRNILTRTVTRKTCKVRGNLSCNSANVAEVISCKLCKGQFVGSAYKNSFKPGFRVHKSDVNIGKDRGSVGKHFLN